MKVVSPMRTAGGLLILIPTLILAPAPPAVWGQEPAGLASSEAADYLGEWTLKMDLQGRPVEMTLSLSDDEGKVTAALEGGRRPEPTLIERVSKTETGLRLEWQRDFGGQQATLAMDLALDGDRLSGTFGDEGGFFSAEVSGSRTGSAAEAAATTAEVATEAQSAQGETSDEEERARRRRRRFGESAELVLANQKIHIGYPDLASSSEDYQSLRALESGKVFTYVGGRAIKLLTDASLEFGDTVIESGNASPDYPGVYSIWLMRADGDDWHLVFNEHADIWGTQYLSEADVAHVPVARETAETETESLEVSLVEMGETAGLLRIAWGSYEWLAPFEVIAEAE